MRERKSLTGDICQRISAAIARAKRPSQGGQMRILMCSNFFPPHVLGGAELVAYQHAKVLQEWGHEVRIFCGRLHDTPSHPYQVTVEKDQFYKTRVSPSPRDVSGETWDFHDEPIRQAFTKALKRFSPDVVHFRNLVGLSVQLMENPVPGV